MPAALFWLPPDDRGRLPLHLQLQTLKRRGDAFFQLRGVQSTPGVLHHDQMRFKLAGFGLRQNKRPERFRGDHHPGQAAFP